LEVLQTEPSSEISTSPGGASRRSGVAIGCLAISTLLLGYLSFSVSSTSFAAQMPPSEYDRVVKPFFTKYCVACHGANLQRGGIRLDTLGHDFATPTTAMHWADVMERMNAAEMPPKGSLQPKPKEVANIADWITAQLKEADAEQKAGLGERVSFHRLTREEYRNTIHDLLGVHVDVTDPAGLPEDPDWQGFQRIGSVLTISPAHIEKYLAAAESALNEALPHGPQPPRELVHWTPFDLRGMAGRDKFIARGGVERVRADIVPNNGANGTPGENQLLDIKTAGEYVVRLKLSALRPTGGIPPRVNVYAADLGRTLFEQDVEAPEDRPITLEFRTHLPAGPHQIRILNAVPGPNPEAASSRPDPYHPFTDLRRRQPWQIKLTDDDYKPLVPSILLDSVEWDGPVLPSWPTPAYRQIFFRGEGATKDSAYARQILARFAERAYRRPVQPAEVDRLVRLFEKSRGLGDSFEASIKTALLAVLSSKSFLYLVEGQQSAADAVPVQGAIPVHTGSLPPTHKSTGKTARAAVTTTSLLTDYEIASRLSYFLWSTTPDARLLELARAGKLHNPSILHAEVQRMMADRRIDAFADSFPRQWLQLRRVGMFPPDRKLYPNYDDYLEKSVVEETTSFFREMMVHNLDIGQFLDSDWTMLNWRLAEHYGIVGVEGEAMQRVALKPEDHRGGLLTQASILSLTSDGTRHRPVHRGKWILESILGKAPPPPPANVPAIKTSAPNERKTSLRAKLEAHRSDPNCAVCHRKIDPLGLAFDNYDAIGHWRTVEAVSDGAGANPAIDPSGVLPDGRKFTDAAELKRLMLADKDKFATAFTEKLATYALRRAMTFSDHARLQRITRQSKSDGYRLASLMQTLVTSDLFQHR
jgi:mono/diheme cytochrome c family protein